MGKTVKKIAKVATLGLSDAVLGSNDMPKVEAPRSSSVAEPGQAPTAVSDETLDAREAMRKRQLAAAGLSGTNLTGAQGLSGGASTSAKSLLGS